MKYLQGKITDTKPQTVMCKATIHFHTCRILTPHILPLYRGLLGNYPNCNQIYVYTICIIKQWQLYLSLMLQLFEVCSFRFQIKFLLINRPAGNSGLAKKPFSISNELFGNSERLVF